MKASVENPYFQKHVPTVFVVGSPLQLLCAIEAEKELEVDDKMYVLVLRPNWSRNDQLLSMANSFNISYNIVYTDDLLYDDMVGGQGFFADRDTCPKYQRLVVGEYFDTYSYCAAYKYAMTGSYMIYLDDGNASIALLEGKSDVPRPTILRKKLLWFFRQRKVRYESRDKYATFFKERGILCTNSFFTLFDSVKSRYAIYPNHFAHIQTLLPVAKTTTDVVLIVGPMFEEIVDMCNIEQERIEAIFWEKLSQLKAQYRNQSIWYIPHGRDNNPNIPMFCDMLGIEYKKISEALEWFVIKNNIKPVAVFGQCSTALYTLKKMMPDIQVVNWFLDKEYDNPIYFRDRIKADAYLRIGIIEERIKFPKLSVKEKIHRCIADIQSLIDWTKERIFKIK